MSDVKKETKGASLRETLGMEGKKDAVVADCVVLVDEEVASKKGVSSIPVKTGYRLVKGIKPGFVAMAVERLLPDFAGALDPFWQAGLASKDPAGHLLDQQSEAAEALLTVTDERIDQASGPVKGAYKRLRATAKKHVEAAMPRLAKLLEKHAG